MNNNALATQNIEFFASQPDDIRNLKDPERNKLIITANQIDGTWIILSRYGDDIWKLTGIPNNVPKSRKQINFKRIPPAFQAVMKAMIYRYITRGRNGSPRPKGSTVRTFFNHALLFIRHLETLKIKSFSAVTPLTTATYAISCKNHETYPPRTFTSQLALTQHYISIEAIYELSQYTHDRMPKHPWPETSARAIAGGVGINSHAKTPLMPDDIFCSLFEAATSQVENAKQILDLRDELDIIAASHKGRISSIISAAKNRHLKSRGWKSSLGEFSMSLVSLRTACYIILASTSGCRNHELANLQLGAHHRTEDDEGTVYHWMRAKSEKTDQGTHNWMIPEAAVRALRIMERWSEPYRTSIADEIAQLRRRNPNDPEIIEASKHRNSLFLGWHQNDDRARTISIGTWHHSLAKFTKQCGLDWKISSHQFRRKFANYAAHSRFGDLRYLKEHFAHWSLDMTLSYAMDDSWGQHLDLDLHLEIQAELEDIKIGVVSSWMEDEALAGGYGSAIKKWQRDPQSLLIFPDPASMLKSIAESTSIRSNGHAWCTADNDRCVGNTLERTRCGAGCNDAVIGISHAPIYRRLYNDLKELRDCADIGEAGRLRVERDLNRSREVLRQLGMDPEDLIA